MELFYLTCIGMTMLMLLYQANAEFRSWANYKLVQLRANFSFRFGSD